MKIVINAFSALRGGGQTYLVNLLGNLDAAAGMELIVLAPESLKLPEDKRIKRVKVNWPTGNPILRSVWERLFLKGFLRETKADVLFCPGGLINTSVPEGCRTVTMFRNMMPFDHAQRVKYPLGLMRLRNMILERALLASMMKADLVIFISDFARELIERRSGGKLKKALTIPHGLTADFKAKSPGARPGWLPSGEYLLYVSILDVYKDQVEIVRGFSQLKKRRNTNEKLILAGFDKTPYAEKVRGEIRRLGLEEDVIIAGHVSYADLPGLYANAKINIFASECENCPNILLEALGAGRPVLSSGLQPMPEFAGDAAVYFIPSSPEDFADKALRILDDEVAMRELSGKAARRALAYDWKKTAELTWKAIGSLI